MALPFLTVPQFPNVPLVPGVPSILRSALFPATPLPKLLLGDGPGAGQATQAPVWGIFDQASGQPAIEPDSFVSFGYSIDHRILDYPLEEGAFNSYNKVATPFDVRITMSIGGSVSDRSLFFRHLDFLQSTLATYNVVTPEKTFLNVNMVHHDYERTSKNGVSLVMVSVFFREIRAATPAAASSSPTSPAVASDAPTEASATPGGIIASVGGIVGQVSGVLSGVTGSLSAGLGGTLTGALGGNLGSLSGLTGSLTGGLTASLGIPSILSNIQIPSAASVISLGGLIPQIPSLAQVSSITKAVTSINSSWLSPGPIANLLAGKLTKGGW